MACSRACQRTLHTLHSLSSQACMTGVPFDVLHAVLPPTSQALHSMSSWQHATWSSLASSPPQPFQQHVFPGLQRHIGSLAHVTGVLYSEKLQPTPATQLVTLPLQQSTSSARHFSAASSTAASPICFHLSSSAAHARAEHQLQQLLCRRPFSSPPQDGPAGAAEDEEVAPDHEAPDTSAHIPDPDMQRLVDELCSLNLIQLTHVCDLLAAKLGMDPKTMDALMVSSMNMPWMKPGGMAGMPAMDAGSGDAEAAPEKEEKQEKTSFDLKLDSFEASGKIKVIKEVRGITGLGLKESKELVENVPAVIKKGLSKEEAEKVKTQLEAAGAKVSLE